MYVIADEIWMGKLNIHQAVCLLHAGSAYYWKCTFIVQKTGITWLIKDDASLLCYTLYNKLYHNKNDPGGARLVLLTESSLYFVVFCGCSILSYLICPQNCDLSNKNEWNYKCQANFLLEDTVSLTAFSPWLFLLTVFSSDPKPWSDV